MTGTEDDESNKIDFLEEDLENDQDIESNLDSDSSEENSKISEEEKLEKVHSELEKQKDLTLRAEAELQNVLKRTAREVENAHKYGLERFIQNLLPVVDSLEKAAEASAPNQSEASETAIEGINLCCKLLVDVLEKEGVKAIDPSRWIYSFYSLFL